MDKLVIKISKGGAGRPKSEVIEADLRPVEVALNRTEQSVLARIIAHHEVQRYVFTDAESAQNEVRMWDWQNVITRMLRASIIRPSEDEIKARWTAVYGNATTPQYKLMVDLLRAESHLPAGGREVLAKAHSAWRTKPGADQLASWAELALALPDAPTFDAGDLEF